MATDDHALRAEQISKEAIQMFNRLSDKFEKDLGRAPTREELEYIREKVMLHFFGFYERELVEKEVVEQDLDKPETD